MLRSLSRWSVLVALMAPLWCAAEELAAPPPATAQRTVYAAVQSVQPGSDGAAPGLLAARYQVASYAPASASVSLPDTARPATTPAAARKAGTGDSLIDVALDSSIDPEFETSALALAFIGLIGLIARRGAAR